MKLTKVDIAQALGLKYNGCFIGGNHMFSFNGKSLVVPMRSWEEEEPWEEAAEKLLEPLVDYLLGNLDDE